MINQFYIDYIKAIENPDRIGWNGKVWTAPQYEGYDKNQRGYGIDIIRNDSAKRLTQDRPGQWLTEGEADRLMKEHILYVYNAAQKHIKGFDNLSDERKAALIGMLYRGDSVNKNRHIININEPDDTKFFQSISNYYKSKGLNERAKNSNNFFKQQSSKTFLFPIKWEQWNPPMLFKNGGQIRKMLTASGGPIHYSRTMTSDNLSKAANYVGGYILKGLGALGKIFTAPLTGGPYGSATVVLPKTKELLDAERKIRETQEELIGKAMTWVSPLNYGTALVTGNGLNAKKGEEEVASWSPAWLAAARLGELYVGPKGVKAAKATPKTVVNAAAKAGSKTAKAAVVAREIKLGIKLNTKNGRIEVTENYFNSPDKWYRITETPEKYGIMELGKNVTTHDASQTYGTINGWRSSMLRAPITKSSEGFIKRSHKIELNIRRKNGQAHGNTSQAAKGKLWEGTTSGSNLFPEGVIEGQAPSMINYGIDRTNFVITPWELIPNGGRVGFHTGEMPMSNLGWFQRTNKGTYTYEPIISEKRINFTPTKLLEPSKTSSTIQISPEELYKVLKDQELNGYYFMGHGTGRSNVNPQIIFDNGLRIKNGDIGNTTSPISLSSLSLWPHANSKEVIILPGRAENVKFDSAHGRIPSDWYDSKTFQWNNNPGFEGSGLFAVLKPNATFVETEINGVPGVYTKPEAILGSYNIDTHTLKLNPRSLYKFFKQGGKMNILEFLKKGSGIHIKKKNRGKFTSYCGGKVTDECIRKAKASGNPTLVKRATFAANARKWKHKKGGILLFLLQGNKIDWAGMIGNFASQALLTYALNKLILAKADLLKEANNALKLSPIEYVSKYFLEIMDEENRRNEAIKAISGTTVNSSDIVGKFFAHQRGKLEAFAHNKEIDNLNKMIDAEAKGLKSQGWMTFGTNLMLTGMGIAGLYLSNKGTTNAAPSTIPTTTGNSSTTGNSIYKLDSFWEKPYLTPNSTSIM